MRTLAKLGLYIIKKSGFTTAVVLKCIVPLIRRFVRSLILARLECVFGNLSVLSNVCTYF